MQNVASFLTACKLLKRDPKKLPIVKHLPKNHAAAIVAQYQLWTIADAIRNGWVPDYNDGNQLKYYPVFCFKSSKAKNVKPNLSFYDVNVWFQYSRVGSRLCFQTAADAEYFGKKFIKLHQLVHRID